MEKNFLLDVGITNASEREILEYILYSLEKIAEKYYIVTPNPEILVHAHHHKDFRQVLNNARLALCDGTGVIWAGKILGKNFKERIAGVEVMENLCKEVSKKPITVGFLGGRDKIAERTAECLREKYPGLQVVFAAAEWPNSISRGPVRSSFPASAPLVSPDGTERVRAVGSPPASATPRSKKNLQLSTFNSQFSIDILFVAFGFPKQEEWMAENLNKIPVRIAMAVGGSFDYISGAVSRAPRWVQNVGLEWLYRLIRQPWRVKRQLALLEFILLVIKAKFNRS